MWVRALEDRSSTRNLLNFNASLSLRAWKDEWSCCLMKSFQVSSPACPSVRFECQLFPLTRVVLAPGELQPMEQDREICSDLTALHGCRSVCRSLYWIPHGPCTLPFKPVFGNTSWDYLWVGREHSEAHDCANTSVSSHLFHLQTGLSYSTHRHSGWKGYRKIRQQITKYFQDLLEVFSTDVENSSSLQNSITSKVAQVLNDRKK